MAEAAIHHRDIPVSQRMDGQPWRVRLTEIVGSQSGPTTAFVAGVFGDKPLGCLALHELIRRLASLDVRGTVLVVPAANPPALEIGTRASPDHLYLNRRFPGAPSGFLTDQIAAGIMGEIGTRADCIVDLHSGTPTMGLWYTYDYGNLEFSSSFGYLPLIVDRAFEGQLSVAATRGGASSCLPEFGGGPLNDPTVGVEGCLNVLRYRGQISGALTGPKALPLIRDVQSFSPSFAGILVGRVGAGDVGKAVEPGVIGRVVSAATGETLEQFMVENRPARLLLARTTPTTVAPGDFAYMVGYPDGEVALPSR
jgi:predicted deacylase